MSCSDDAWAITTLQTSTSQSVFLTLVKHSWMPEIMDMEMLGVNQACLSSWESCSNGRYTSFNWFALFSEMRLWERNHVEEKIIESGQIRAGSTCLLSYFH